MPPSDNKPDETPDEPLHIDARDARGAEIILRKRRNRMIFFGALAVFVVFAVLGLTACAVEGEVESGDHAMFMERLPGEARSHRVLDDGSTPVDDTPEFTLGEDEYFLLGDNRDHAADSRMEAPPFGLGIVSGSQITRRVELD